MARKVNVRAGDTVYHNTLDLGKGKVRYVYHDAVLVVFEKAEARRYPKAMLCKSASHFSNGSCKSCGFVRQSAA